MALSPPPASPVLHLIDMEAGKERRRPIAPHAGSGAKAAKGSIGEGEDAEDEERNRLSVVLACGPPGVGWLSVSPVSLSVWDGPVRGMEAWMKTLGPMREGLHRMFGRGGGDDDAGVDDDEQCRRMGRKKRKGMGMSDTQEMTCPLRRGGVKVRWWV